MFPIFVIPPCLRASPVDRSDGTRTRNAISYRGWSNRRMLPVSATTVVAFTKERPRIAWNAVTTGAIVLADAG